MDDRDDLRGHGPEGDSAELRLLRVAGPRRAVPQDREARVRAAVHGHWQRRVAARRPLTWWWTAAALAAAAAVVAAVLPRLVKPAPAASQVAVVEVLSGDVTARNAAATSPLSLGAGLARYTVVETAEHGRLALRLPGGASLRIDGASRVALDEANVVHLDRGAVYVDSGRARAVSGVAVTCGFAEVREVGTQFEVRILEDGLRVRAREGVVLVHATGRDEEITAGTEATLRADGSLTTRAIAPYGPEWGWVLSAAPAFKLDGRTAGDLLRWVSRESGLELRWAEPRLAKLAERTILHGDISGVRPDEAPAVVLPTCGFASKVDGGHLLIEAAGG
jgi:hypothetical protein